MRWGERGHSEGRGGVFDSVSGFFHQSHIPAHAITLRESATTYTIHVEPIYNPLRVRKCILFIKKLWMLSWGEEAALQPHSHPRNRGLSGKIS